MTEIVQQVVYQLERPDGTVLYREALSSAVDRWPPLAPRLDKNWYLGDLIVRPPWRLRRKVGNQEWITVDEVLS